MFCDACGAQVQTDQRFCGTCGKALGAVVAGRITSRVADHRQILGSLWIVYSFLHLIGACVLFVIAHTLIPHLAEMSPPHNMPPGGVHFLIPFLTLISILMMTKGLLDMTSGIGLLQKQHWARTIALVSGFISLISVPVGTALGIYTIWVLMSGNGEEEYAKLAGSGA